jgi:hypothetical protein
MSPRRTQDTGTNSSTGSCLSRPATSCQPQTVHLAAAENTNLAVNASQPSPYHLPQHVPTWCRKYSKNQKGNSAFTAATEPNSRHAARLAKTAMSVQQPQHEKNHGSNRDGLLSSLNRNETHSKI